MDGVVIACESQGTFAKGVDMKRLDISKILPIAEENQSIISLALGGSGTMSQITLLAEEMRKRLGDRTFDDEQLRESAYQVLLELYRKYNVERSRFLGLSEIQTFFDPRALLGARLQNNRQISFGLYLLSPNAWVTPIDDYETIGSGAPFADFMMAQIKRGLGANLSLSKLTMDSGLQISCYVINEVKEHDIYSGGRTRVAVIDGNGYRELSSTEIRDIYNKFLDEVDEIFGKGLDSLNMGKKPTRKFFPVDSSS